MSETIHTISTDAATLNEIADAVEADAPDPIGYRKATVILTLKALAMERAATAAAPVAPVALVERMARAIDPAGWVDLPLTNLDEKFVRAMLSGRDILRKNSLKQADAVLFAIADGGYEIKPRRDRTASEATGFA
jgi:hypothetical protein